MRRGYGCRRHRPGEPHDPGAATGSPYRRQALGAARRQHDACNRVRDLVAGRRPATSRAPRRAWFLTWR